MMLPINNTTEDFFLLCQLQFNLQSLKCFNRRSFNNSVIHYFTPTPRAERGVGANSNI